MCLLFRRDLKNVSDITHLQHTDNCNIYQKKTMVLLYAVILTNPYHSLSPDSRGKENKTKTVIHI